MLCLDREEGQSIMIGDNIRIEIARLGKAKVRVAIDAPKEIIIHRLEVFEAIKAGEPVA